MHSWLTKIDRHMGAANFKGDGGIDHEAIQGIEGKDEDPGGSGIPVAPALN